MHDTNSINRANLINMIRLMRQDQQESEVLDEVNYDDVEENDNDNDNDNDNENDNDNDNENDNDNDDSNSINSYELFEEMSLLSNNKEKDSSEYSNDMFTEERDYLFLNYRRATTAPTKQLNDSSEFKKSLSYINLEKAVIYSNRLIIEPTEEGEKFDVDSEEGIFICKKFLEQLEKLIYVNLN
jgi:hypothetical protein